MKKRYIILIAFFTGLLILGCFTNDRHYVPAKESLRAEVDLRELPTEVIIPASDFLEEIPKGNIIASAAELEVSWGFNNTALILNSPSNMMSRVEIPRNGTYYLYVRSQGRGRSFSGSSWL